MYHINEAIMNIYRRFVTFLEVHQCAREFDIEFERQNPGYHLDENLWNILGGDEFFLARAFDWTESSKGREYWATLDFKWYQLAINHK